MLSLAFGIYLSDHDGELKQQPQRRQRTAKKKSVYYINTNKILGELSYENLISSQVKITCYLHM